MSQQRLELLRNQLYQKGWRILNEEDDEMSGLFEVENESVLWSVVRNPDLKIIEIEFVIFGELGRTSESINDIFSGNVIGREGQTLYFDKIKSKAWQEGVKSFVASLDKI